MTASDVKVCGLCGEDCSDRPRTRDRLGRYFCKTCYADAAARARSGHSDAPLSADTHEVDATVLAAILDRASADEPLAEAPEVCHRCGKSFEPGSMVCPRCGEHSDHTDHTAPSTPEFSVTSPTTGPTYIPTWLMVVVPLVAVVLIVFAALPSKRRAPATIAPSPSGATAPAASLAAPDLTAPLTFESNAIEFRYPGNWRLDTAYPGFDRERYIVVDNTRDAQLIIGLVESSRSVELELASKLDTLRGSGGGYTDRNALDTYGSFTGAGRTVTTYLGTEPSRYRIFLARTGLNRHIEIHEICPERYLPHAEPGFDFIAASLQPK